MAKYTFTEQCEEVEGLHLDDGTMKIFLNMESKNGTPELISLLQYMKNTTLDNPEILIRDDRMEKLDSIVNEVKESEEWEVVRMSIYSVAYIRGEEDGRKAGMKAGMEAGMEAGMKAGKEAGMEAGKEAARIEMICKQLRRGRSLEFIADVLEEDIDTLEQMFEVIERFAPDYKSEKVIKAWLKHKDK